MKIRKIRQVIAMFLCVLMVTKLAVPVMATATDSNAQSEAETQHIVLNTEDGVYEVSSESVIEDIVADADEETTESIEQDESAAADEETTESAEKNESAAADEETTESAEQDENAAADEETTESIEQDESAAADEETTESAEQGESAAADEDATEDAEQNENADVKTEGSDSESESQGNAGETDEDGLPDQTEAETATGSNPKFDGCEHCGALSGEEHKEDCVTRCTCEAIDGIHAADCPLYAGPVCTCDFVSHIHEVDCDFYIVPIDAKVYTENEGSYTLMDGHDSNHPINIKSYDNQILYVETCAEPQNIYFEQKTLLDWGIIGTDFEISNAGYAVLEEHGALLGSNKATVTLAAEIPAETEISLSTKEYSVEIVVLDEIPGMSPDYDSEITAEIMDALTVLEAEMAASLEGKTGQECRFFYDEMMSAYAQAFDNDELIVSTDDIAAIDAQFERLESELEDQYGFTDCYDYETICFDEEGNPITADELEVSVFASRRMMRTSAEEEAAEIVTGKRVDSISENGYGDYMLTLESYVTGEVVDLEKPADIVLALDQSASMYIPIGLSGMLKNSTDYDEDGIAEPYTSTDEVKNGLERYTQEELSKLMNDETKDSAGLTFEDKIAKRGYLIAQSRTGGYSYCMNKDGAGGHECGDSCRTFDFFVVEYVSGDEKPWHLYRVPNTSTPSEDSKVTSYDENKKQIVTSHEAAVVKYASLEKMDGSEHFYFYKTQYGALYDSITAFAHELKNSGADHRLGVVGYSSAVDTGLYREGSGLYINGIYTQFNENEYDESDPTRPKDKDAESCYQASTIESSTYQSALVDVHEDFESILNSINAVKTDTYGTCQNVGFYMANRIFENNPIPLSTDNQDIGRDRIVILFTDGAPSGPTNDSIVAQAHISKRTTTGEGEDMQFGAGAKVFTICTSTISAGDSKFLDYASSDYPDAVSMDTVGEPIENPSYAKRVTTAGSLLSAFKKVVEDVGGTESQLDETTIMQDVISGDFTLDAALVQAMDGKNGEDLMNVLREKIKVYTAASTGNRNFVEKEQWESFDNASIEIKKDSSGRYVVRISNFDYAENYVSNNGRDVNGTEFFGKKLIVQIPIEQSSDSAGGNALYTNVRDSSGIYSATADPENPSEVLETSVARFDQPKVDLPTTVTVKKEANGSGEFEFNIDYIKFKAYEDDGETSGNSLTAEGTTVADETFQLSSSGAKQFESLLVGSRIVISEKEDERFHLKEVQVNGEPVSQVDGEYAIVVTPNMVITFVNERTLADLVIRKSGADLLDEYQSFIFNVSNESGTFKTKVAVVGNGTITIKDLPVDKYIVTEAENWSWRYDTTNYKYGSLELEETELTDNGSDAVMVDLTSGNVQVVVVNNRDNQKWMDGNNHCTNIFHMPFKKPAEEESN